MTGWHLFFIVWFIYLHCRIGGIVRRMADEIDNRCAPYEEPDQ